MRFAIAQNICPSCGHNLMSLTEQKQIKLLKERVAQQSFSSSLKEEGIQDVALFVYNEVTKGFGKVYFESIAPISVPSVPEETNSKEAEMKRIREAVSKEYTKALDDEDMTYSENESDNSLDDLEAAEGVVFSDNSDGLDEKTRRLRDLARASNKPTFTVRRSQ